MNALDLLNLAPLMKRTTGRASLRIGLVDGAVAAHPDLASPVTRLAAAAASAGAAGSTCGHGTFVAGILGARRGAGAPGLCPACPLVVWPVFRDAEGSPPAASAAELAEGVREVVRAGARIVNLSAALTARSSAEEEELIEALDAAARADVVVIAAAGNLGRVASLALTRHHAVVPVVSCDAAGRPSTFADLSGPAGRRGLMAPGEGLVSLAPGGRTRSASGTSFAAALVTGAAALLWSLFPSARAAEIRLALCSGPSRRSSIVPPLVDAERAYQLLSSPHRTSIQDRSE